MVQRRVIVYRYNVMALPHKVLTKPVVSLGYGTVIIDISKLNKLTVVADPIRIGRLSHKGYGPIHYSRSRSESGDYLIISMQKDIK